MGSSYTRIHRDNDHVPPPQASLQQSNPIPNTQKSAPAPNTPQNHNHR